MGAREIRKGVLAVGVNDWDRRVFDELIPLPDGTSYNSYLVLGSEKNALIDSADPEKKEEFFSNLRSSGVKRIDYVLANHAEQDHSGNIPIVLEKFPDAKLVTNEKCAQMLKELLHIDDSKFRIIKEGDELDLGGKKLAFIMAPWVHWPETMLTYLKEDKILFSCDLFGSHFATSELYAKDNGGVIMEAKRYYAEIMMPFAKVIRKHLERIEKLEVELIAPSHGPIYERPGEIIGAYKEWTSDEVKDEVIIPYISMHGSTVKIVERLVDGLVKNGVKEVRPFNIAKTDVGELTMALVDAATVVVASPTVLVGAHPHVMSTAYLMNLLRPKTRYLAIIGSYGWGGHMAENLKDSLSNVNAELIDTVVLKGLPDEKALKKIDALAEEIAKRHSNLG